MAMGTFDNPVTMCREIWVDKRLKASASLSYLMNSQSKGWYITDWQANTLWGRIDAIPQEFIQHVYRTKIYANAK